MFRLRLWGLGRHDGLRQLPKNNIYGQPQSGREGGKGQFVKPLGATPCDRKRCKNALWYNSR